MLEIFLEQEGLNILKAYDGQEMLEVLESNEVHLVLLDIMMPKLDGLKAMRLLRQKNNIPVILVSAKSEKTDKITGLNFGADDYITKPFEPFELVARVKSQLRRYTTLGSMVKQDNILVLAAWKWIY